MKLTSHLDKQRGGRIAREWRDFNRRVIPPDAPAVQRSEMRRAFYAGVQVMMGIARGLGDPSVSEEAGVAVLEGIEAEMREFVDLIREGRA